MSPNIHTVLLVLTMSAVTQLLRFLPFALFSKGTPKPVLYLGRVLPAATMAMLVVYCLKNVSFGGLDTWAPEALAVGLVVALHKWKDNTLLSIVGGTAAYMLLVQVVF